MDVSVTVAGETNEVVAVLQVQFSSVFVFEIAFFSTSTGFSWDHHGIFSTLSSRLVKIPGHKYYFVPTRTQSLNSGIVPAKRGHLATMVVQHKKPTWLPQLPLRLKQIPTSMYCEH